MLRIGLAALALAQKRTVVVRVLPALAVFWYTGEPATAATWENGRWKRLMDMPGEATALLCMRLALVASEVDVVTRANGIK